MIEDHYEINVAILKNNKWTHFCKIILNTIIKKEVLEKYKEISKLFPINEYKLTLSKVECRGIIIDDLSEL